MKKANFMFEASVELLGLVLLLIGLILAIISRSAMINYAIGLLSGAVFGRMWYRVKYDLKMGMVLIILGFVSGLLIGSFYGNRALVIILFAIGFVLSYYIHDKGIISSEEW